LGTDVNEYFPLNIPQGYYHEESDLSYAGTIDHEAYSIARLSYKDSLYNYTKVQLCRLRETGFDEVVSYQGYVGHSTFLKGKTAYYITGYYYDWLRAGSFNLYTKGEHLYVAKLRPNLKVVDVSSEGKLNNALFVYPIPVHDKLFIRLPHTVQNGRWWITDLSGKLILSNSISNISISEDILLSDLKSGMYLLKVESEDFASTRKIIKD
jgi:hypothetical protein